MKLDPIVQISIEEIIRSCDARKIRGKKIAELLGGPRLLFWTRATALH